MFMIYKENILGITLLNEILWGSQKGVMYRWAHACL